MVKTSAAMLMLVCAVGAGVSSAQAQGTPPASAGTEVQEGRRLYQAKCAVCHVPATRRAEPYGPPLSKMQASTDTAVRAIQNGGARMPGFQYALAPSQIAAIIMFLKTLDAPPDRIVVDTPTSP